MTVQSIMDAAYQVRDKAVTISPDAPIRVGVDLGTAYTVIFVTDEHGTPLTASWQFADVVRDGVVWDFVGAVDIVRSLKERVEANIGRELEFGAVTIPPDVDAGSHKAHRYVLESAGIECSAIVDEPVAANAILGVTDGAVVDIGGGTTGTAILADGKVLAVADEPTGGTHLSLVIAGALNIPFEEAEETKRNEANHQRILPLVKPVIDKIATIVDKTVQHHEVTEIYVVGGTAELSGIQPILQRSLSAPVHIAPHPMLVTPLGAAHFDTRKAMA